MSRWYDRKYTDKDVKEIRGFLKTFDVKLRFLNCIHGGGSADYVEGIAYIDGSERTSLRFFVSMALHELWHCLCYRQGLYSTYHCDKMPTTRKQLIKFRSVAWKAEQFVDDRANEMMKAYFPDIPYKFGYEDKEDKEWFYKHYVNKYYSIS